MHHKTPSAIFYKQKSLLKAGKVTFSKFVLWYLGIKNISKEIENEMENNKHLSIIENLETYKEYMNIDKIPKEFTNGRSYYDDYEKVKDKLYAETKLDDSNVLIRDKNLNSLVKKLADPDVSPLFADRDKLIGLPKAYFIVLEWDTLKDECLLYAERLKEAGVDVHLAFYENAFHGMANLVTTTFGFEKARLMQKDLIEYLKVNL